MSYFDEVNFDDLEMIRRNAGTPEAEIKELRASITRMKERYNERIREEREYRADLNKCIRRMERRFEMITLVGGIALVAFFLQNITEYWEKGDTLNALALVVSLIVLVWWAQKIEK